MAQTPFKEKRNYREEQLSGAHTYKIKRKEIKARNATSYDPGRLASSYRSEKIAYR
jgi:hypothetical protein